MENLTLTSNTVNGIELPSVSVAITPAVITTNYEELDKAITKIADSYRIIQYSEDPETQIKQMKADRSALNKLSKAVNDEKIRIKKEASKEISSFEDNFKKLLEKIADPVTKINAGIKDIEEKRREGYCGKTTKTAERSRKTAQGKDGSRKTGCYQGGRRADQKRRAKKGRRE